MASQTAGPRAEGRRRPAPIPRHEGAANEIRGQGPHDERGDGPVLDPAPREQHRERTRHTVRHPQGQEDGGQDLHRVAESSDQTGGIRTLFLLLLVPLHLSSEPDERSGAPLGRRRDRDPLLLCDLDHRDPVEVVRDGHRAEIRLQLLKGVEHDPSGNPAEATPARERRTRKVLVVMGTDPLNQFVRLLKGVSNDRLNMALRIIWVAA